ncbi:TRAFAC clade GTPase domain-containing protein [Leptospira interrogans]|uniref:TRAFAC clade GTPase domain-containing protein n=1 Tax=Leptospira interrogans TaxID=173 RepID=UPI0007730D43|nr:hypothetical protein [Leptospira interrogans]
MSEAVLEKRCDKEGCTVSISGACSEGHKPLEACPNFGKDNVNIDLKESEEEDTQLRIDSIVDDRSTLLFSGELLDSEEVEKFLRQRPVTFISVIGDRNSGKTTLISSLYERYRQGKFSGYYFSGSVTLIGVERSLHYSRLESGSNKIDTQRTLLSDGLKYFHLSISPVENLNAKRDLMFSDRAGETYRNARSNTVLIKDLIEIPRADKVLLLLDGARISDPEERSDSMQSTRQMLRALIDNGALGSDSHVQIITTKIDLLTKNPDYKMISEILENFKNKLVLDFGAKICSLTFWDVSTRDPSGELELVYGVDELILDWVTEKKSIEVYNQNKIEFKTEFDKLLLRSNLDKIIL